MESGKALFTLSVRNLEGFSPDSKYLLSTSGNAIQVWDMSSGALVHTLEAGDSVFKALFSADGRFLASVSVDNTVRLWDVSSGKLLQKFDLATGFAKCCPNIAFSPNNQWLAIADSDGVIRIWQISDGKLLKTLRGHVDAIEDLQFSSDSKALVSQSYSGDKSAVVWYLP